MFFLLTIFYILIMCKFDWRPSCVPRPSRTRRRRRRACCVRCARSSWRPQRSSRTRWRTARAVANVCDLANVLVAMLPMYVSSQEFTRGYGCTSVARYASDRGLTSELGVGLRLKGLRQVRQVRGGVRLLRHRTPDMGKVEGRG